MGIESIIYTRLSEYTDLTEIVGTKIYPTVPTENTQLPFVIYQASSAEPQLHTQGASGLTKYTVEINAHGINLDTVLAILGACRNALHAYRGGNVQGSFLQTESTQEEEYGHFGLQTYSVWVTTANVTATIDSTGSITTGADSVTLNACDNTLTLDCDGLTLNGEPVGETPDLTPYARKDDQNTFTENQIIEGTVTIGNVNTVDQCRISGHLITLSNPNTGQHVQISRAGDQSILMYFSNRAEFRPGTGLQLDGNMKFGWVSDVVLNSGIDTGLARASAGNVKVTDGSTGLGGIVVNTLNVASDGFQVMSNGTIRVSTAITTEDVDTETVSYWLPIYDQNGTQLGLIPIHPAL